MIESLFILVVVMAFILLIVAHMEQSIAFTMLDIMLWLLIMAYSAYVEVPFSTEDNIYTEYGFSVACLMFIFFNVFQLIYFVIDWRTQDI